ncbi:sensor histidine kinase [Aerococcaceae bacterium zg-ZJ1578]|uniref:sensor histidine kinase n=1 Tax=Aerococcaceae bacterium zg-252 TaxID=2796928 RepID=UPI001A1BE6C7|nr:sensor histidine kinase [Aerococcaceae bacterium zg-1578]
MSVFKKIHPMYFGSLIYLIFPIYYVLSGEYPLWTLPLTILFAIAYLSLTLVKQEWVKMILFLYLCVYIVLLTLYGGIGSTLFIYYVTNILTWHFQEDTVTSKRYIIFYITYAILLYFISQVNDIETIVFLSILHVVAIGMMYVMRKNLQEERLKRVLQEKNESINLLLAENERNRIGQDLHDTLGHVFAMLSIKSELAVALMENKEYDKARKEIEELRAVTTTSMKEVRQIVESLKRHTVAEELQILHNMFAMAQVTLAVTNSDLTRSLSESVQSVVTMILRECGNNLLKHSQATHCHIGFEQKSNQMIIIVEDNGIGFETVTGEELHSIRERLTTIKGHLDITTLKNPTQITMWIPLSTNDRV